jgi:hypothetical protein
MPTLTRRGLIVLGGTGAAGAVLAACGAESEERDSADDAGLLSAAYDAESALTATYTALVEDSSGDELATLESFQRTSRARAEELRTLAADAGAEPAGGETPSEPGLAGAIAAAESAIAAYRDATGLLSTEDDRATAIANLAAVAAELAAVRALDGADPVPFAFVTGGDVPPLVAPDETATEEEDSES